MTLYSLVNGVLTTTGVTATSSTVNGSFTFQLPFSLTDGSTVLYARTTDIAGNTGPLSPPLNLRGDHGRRRRLPGDRGRP